jgi:hypothetical protein
MPAPLDIWACTNCGMRTTAEPTEPVDACPSCHSVDLAIVSIGAPEKKTKQSHGTQARFDRWAQIAFLGWCGVRS